MKIKESRTLTAVFIIISLLMVILSGCGSSGSDTAGQSKHKGTPFWAIDFSTGSPYRVYAKNVATGTHCYIYLEDGQRASGTAIDTIKNEFDNNIYPNDVAAFGDEPNPGVDNDPRIYILLSNFKEPGGNSYVAGYFYSLNEYVSDPTDTVLYPYTQYSNEKEMFYMNIDPTKGIVPGNQDFFNVLAHEFQHMIHWQQKNNLQGINDDTWLNEAMSEVARTYCGYGYNAERSLMFYFEPTHSLTLWDSQLYNYETVYMWGQYFRDRFPSDIFYRMVHNSGTGIASVTSELTTSFTDFNTTFKDWSIALATGTTTTWWHYTSFTPAVLTIHDLTTLPTKSAYSLGFYDYAATGPTGTVKWTAKSPAEKATFINQGGNIVHYEIGSGSSYTYSITSLLLTQNVNISTSGGGTVVYSALKYNTPDTVLTPGQMLEKADQRMRAQNISKPEPICIQPWLASQEAALRAKGAMPSFK